MNLLFRVEKIPVFWYNISALNPQIPTKRGTFMDSIIADNLRAEQTISSRIDLFFHQHSISKLLKRSNFYKDSGVPCVEIMKTLFSLVFTEKNLYRTLETSPDRITFSKNADIIFLIAKCIYLKIAEDMFLMRNGGYSLQLI